jgi:ribosomal protein S14
MTANEAYGKHRESCYLCGAVDLGMRNAQRCAMGRMKVRAATLEGKMRRYKLKIKAQDLVLLKQMGIVL